MTNNGLSEKATPQIELLSKLPKSGDGASALPAEDEEVCRAQRLCTVKDRLSLTHIVRLRVRYDETDLMGITYHGRYLDWFVIGRTEWFRSIGLPYSELERKGLHLPVLQVQCRYVASTRYDDVVEVQTTLTKVKRTRLSFRYEVRRVAPWEGTRTNKQIVVAAGETEHAFVGSDHRPLDVGKRFPQLWRRLLPLAAALKEQKVGFAGR